MLKPVQKILLSFLIALFLIPNSLFFIPSTVHAQSTWYNQDFGDWYSRVYGSPPSDVFGERYTSAQVQWIFYALAGHLLNTAAGAAGVDPSAISCIFTESKGGLPALLGKAADFAPPGIKDAIHVTGTMAVLVKCGFSGLIDKVRDFKLLGDETSGTKTGIAEFILFTDRPLSSATYLRNTLQGLHMIPEARAQTSPGFGFQALNPVLSLWRASRNVAYAILVFAILAISFMIMFRVKINPQTVISVQSALPKIIFALILITFSYAIAGFLVDIMYVVLGLLSLIFSQVTRISAPAYFSLMTVGPAGLGIFGVLTVYFLIPNLLLLIGLLVALLSLFTGVGAFLSIVIIILVALVMITMFIFFIKILWLLLKTFAYIILLTAFAPIQIAIGIIIPSFGFGQWVKSMASNLAVFVIINLFLALTAFLTGSAINLALSNASPPAPGWPPLLNFPGGNFGTAIIYLGVAFTTFAVIPKVSDIIKAMIEGKPFAYGTAIGEAIGPFTGPARTISSEGLAALGAKQEFAAKAAGTSPYLYGTGTERAVYAALQALRSVLGGRR